MKRADSWPGGSTAASEPARPGDEHGFELFLFSTDAERIAAARRAGLSGLIIDWERRGKADRQAGFDTQIGTDSPADLQRVRSFTSSRLICRINKHADRAAREREIDRAARCGCDEILLPMVESVEEVASVLEYVHRRHPIGVGILVETVAAVRLAPGLARLPLARVFVGLNDLAIERGLDNIFDSVADGTVEAVLRCFSAPVGFAGLTLPDRGAPIPCRLLMAEMARLGCGFAFLRRSFLRDTRVETTAAAIAKILATVARERGRPRWQLEEDHRMLVATIRQASAQPAFRFSEAGR